jgi:hypothetical protein
MRFIRYRVLRSGQARTIAFLVPPLSDGVYFVEIRGTYTGLLVNKEGKFKDSADPPIDAVEQTIVSVPAKILSGSAEYTTQGPLR